MLNFRVRKVYASQAQRNLFEACRADPGFSDKCPDEKTLADYHEKSRGKMKDKDLPEKVDDKEKKTKKSLGDYLYL